MNVNDASFEELLNALHDGVYITDGDGKTLKVNQAYERQTGLSGADLIGRSMQELVKEGQNLKPGDPLAVIAEHDEPRDAAAIARAIAELGG